MSATGCGGPWGCEMLGIPHCLDNRFLDGGDVRFTHRPRSSPQKNVYFYLWYTFLLVNERTQGPMQLEELDNCKQFNYLVWSRNLSLPDRSIVLQQVNLKYSGYNLPIAKKNAVSWDVTLCVGCYLQLALFLVYRFLSP
jgi:hypothetical protein